MKNIKHFLLVAFLFCLLIGAAHAQPQLIGGVVHIEFERAGTGNGTIAGGGVEAVNKIKMFTLVNSLTITADKKGYLNAFGWAPRLHTRARYYLPFASDEKRTFLQAGFNLSGVQYSGEGGYAKFAFQPVAGFGFDFSPHNGVTSIVGGYTYKFKSALHAKKSFFSSEPAILDGWTWGQEGTIETATPIQPGSKWVLLVNGSAGRTNYQRNAGVYGTVLGAEVHGFAVYELSIGIGRKY